MDTWIRAIIFIAVLIGVLTYYESRPSLVLENASGKVARGIKAFVRDDGIATTPTKAALKHQERWTVRSRFLDLTIDSVSYDIGGGPQSVRVDWCAGAFETVTVRIERDGQATIKRD